MSETSAGIGAETVLSKPLTTRARRMRGQVIVANGESAYELDEVSAFIFARIDGRRSIADIGQAIATEYDVPPDEATADAVELAQQLLELGLVAPAS